MGVLEADDVAAEFRQFQPLRHLALEHAAFAPITARAATFAGDHQDELGAIALRLAQEDNSAACASLWVLPSRSMRASIDSVPRARRCLSRRSNGSSPAAALAAGTAARAGG